MKLRITPYTRKNRGVKVGSIQSDAKILRFIFPFQFTYNIIFLIVISKKAIGIVTKFIY